MSFTDKLDLDGLLKAWPAPSTRDDAAWEERADIMVEAAVARRLEGRATLDALLDAPPLTPEPGEGPADAEPRPTPAPGRTHLRALPGGEEGTMSQGSDDQDGGRKSVASLPPERRRPSLKEIAARASQSGLSAPPPSRAGAPLSTPLPPPISTTLSSRSGSIPSARSIEVDKEDSGLIDLKAVNAEATPQQKAAAEKAQPGTAELGFEEDGKGADAQMPRRSMTLPATLRERQQKRSGGLAAGVVIAVVGLAASFAIMQTRKPADAPLATQEAPVIAPEQPQPGEAAPAAPATGTPIAEAPPAEQVAADEAKPAEDNKLAAGPTSVGAAAPASPAGAPAAEAPAAPLGKLPTAAAPPPAKPGDLSTAMQNAVGDQGTKAGATDAPAPAAGKPTNQNIPEQPSQGSLQAAVGSVMGSAKACVAGAGDVSRAQVTFSSAGSVSNVSVTGWAASNGASSCIKSALKGANVGPFSKPSFTQSVTIRP